MRLDKLLCEMQIGTRSEVKKYIKSHLVTVNDDSNVKPEQKVNPQTDRITFRGKDICYEPYVYYMFHKPMGCVTARTDGMHQTVMDYIQSDRADLSPVGRLDIDTTGLLLITNDGQLSHNLLSPKKHVDKIYEADIAGKVTEEDVMLFSQGLDIGDDTLTKPAKLTILVSDEISRIHLSVTEGRFHQVKRMFEAVNKKVLSLKRLSMGSLILDETLLPGEYRRLTETEIMQLKGQEESIC